MLKMNFFVKNYADFQQKFPMRLVGVNSDGSPKFARTNKIFLNVLKHACSSGNYDKLYQYMRRFNGREFVPSIDLADLYNKIVLNGTLGSCYNQPDEVISFHSDKYALDDLKGVCTDGDLRSIRYINRDSGAVYKMKAGKFMLEVLKERGVFDIIGQSGANYICETFAQKWEAYTNKLTGDYKLKVDQDFEFIYNSNNQIGNFGSCMTDKGYESFYNYVDASAASIVNYSGMMLARCVIFNNVTDQNGKVWRLAERQYAESNLRKELLVNALIKAGRIDGYKTFSAGAGDSRSFLDNQGNSISNLQFKTDISISSGDYASYQDSFKWYTGDGCGDGFIDNYGCGECVLETTDGEFYPNCYDDDENYDEVNDEYTRSELITVYIWTRNGYLERRTSEDYINEYTWLEWGEMYVDDYHYSDLMDERLPLDRWDEIEEEWKSENWEWDEYNKEYVYETVECNIWTGDDYRIQSVGRDYADNYFEYIDGEYYDEIDCETKLPYGQEQEIEVESVN